MTRARRTAAAPDGGAASAEPYGAADDPSVASQGADAGGVTPAPEPRYGWVLVGLGALSIGFQGGILLANSLFLVAIADDTGWPRATISGAISLLVLGNAAWSPVVGWLIQRYGTRRVMPPAALMLAVGLYQLARAHSPVELALVMLLLLPPGAVGAGTLANYAAIQGWFERRRGTALALADAGSALGGLVVVPFVLWLLDRGGWRAAYQGLAAVALVFALAQLALQRPAPHVAGQSAAGSMPALTAAQLLRLPTFWLVGLGLMASWFALQVVGLHQAAYLADAGFETAAVATAVALTGGVSLVGRLGFGALSDRIGTARSFALVTACLLVGIGFLVAAGESGMLLPLWLFGLSFGLGYGVGTLLYARRTADLFGSWSFGTAWGLAYLCASLGGAGGAATGGLLAEATGSYQLSFAVAAGALLASCACMRALDRHAGGPDR